jgi:hypothetical protein
MCVMSLPLELDPSVGQADGSQDGRVNHDGVNVPSISVGAPKAS